MRSVDILWSFLVKGVVVDFWKRFWAAVLSLTGIVALYLTALPLHLLWVFWAVIGLAAAYAGISIGFPRVADWVKAVRNHPALLNAAATAEREAGRLRSELNAAETAANTQWSAGLEEGRRQIIGGILAARVVSPPQPVAVHNDAEGRTILVATCNDPNIEIGARFRLSASSAGVSRGVVEVVDIDDARRVSLCRCDLDRAFDRFWEYLAQKAETDTMVQPGLELTPELAEPFEEVGPVPSDGLSAIPGPEA